MVGANLQFGGMEVASEQWTERERSLVAVSYTHLDVYKRQIYYWATQKTVRAENWNI